MRWSASCPSRSSATPTARVETWQGGTLVGLSAETDKNGQREWVNARRTGEGLVVTGSRTARYVAPEPAIATSYWDRRMVDGPMISLEDGVLLRPKVAVRRAETDPARVRRHDHRRPLQSQRRVRGRCLVRPDRHLGRACVRASPTAPPSPTSGCEPPVTLDGFLIAHGSALILPLAVIEGPFVVGR